LAIGGVDGAIVTLYNDILHYFIGQKEDEKAKCYIQLHIT